MKFSHYTELQRFVEKNLFPSEYKDMYEIYTGGSSYNFCVITTKGKYFLKLLEDKGAFCKIKEFCRLYGVLYESKSEDFREYKFLLTKFIDGHKIRYRDCTETVIECLWHNYQKILNCKPDSAFIYPMIDINVLFTEAETALKESKKDIFSILYAKIMALLKRELVYLPETHNLIHGDLMANNILLAADGSLHIIDGEMLRYGHISEDMASLLLELSGFLGIWGNMSRFKRLFSSINKYALLSSKEWLYGIQIVYLTLIKRRLNNPDKQSFRKRLCLFLIMLQYFRIRNFINE